MTIDFQLARESVGEFDLAYFIATSLPSGGYGANKIKKKSCPNVHHFVFFLSELAREYECAVVNVYYQVHNFHQCERM